MRFEFIAVPVEGGGGAQKVEWCLPLEMASAVGEASAGGVAARRHGGSHGGGHGGGSHGGGGGGGGGWDGDIPLGMVPTAVAANGDGGLHALDTTAEAGVGAVAGRERRGGMVRDSSLLALS